jgi:hypothetical protein
MGDLCHSHACCQRMMVIYLGVSTSQYQYNLVYVRNFCGHNIKSLKQILIIVKCLRNNSFLILQFYYQKRAVQSKEYFHVIARSTSGANI